MKKMKSIVEKMIYENSIQEVIKQLKDIREPEILYLYMFNYNWDNGFEIPQIIINKDTCDLSTALMIFYNADGIAYLKEKSGNVNLEEWSVFISKLYENIMAKKYIKSNILFIPPLSKFQMVKLKKELSKKEMVFIEEITGRNLNIYL